jgi:hypothetical protein
MATFTTWTDLLTGMLNALASQDMTVLEAHIADKVVRYNTPKDIRDHIEYVRTQASFEQGTAAPRTYAGQGGRG